MPRIKISRQPVYPRNVELAIRVSDLNYGAHLGYDRVLTLAHEARVQIFSAWSITELDVGDGKTGLVVGDVGVNYLGEGFAGNILEVGICPLEVGAVTFRLAHRFFNRTTGKDLAYAEIGFVAFDYSRRMPGRLPESFIARLQAMSQT